jgi:cobalt/nickel transport system permease protein
MSGRHRASVHGLHHPGASPVHHAAPEAKLLGLLLFVVAVAVTPRDAVAVFAVDAAVLLAVIGWARLPFRLVVARLAVITQFVLVALVLPFVAHGPRTDFGPLSVSLDGTWAAWNIIVKAVLGAAAAIVVSATTPLPAILQGLTRLHVPRVLVAIVSSMVRYLELLAGQLGRMRRSMTARAHDPRWLWQVRPIASSVGLLFVRSYERGERVHLAMVARGFTGRLPTEDRPTPSPAGWATALAPAAVAFGALVLRTAAT